MTSNNSGVTLYLVYLVFVATLGPLQFGYHLVWITTLSRMLGWEKCCEFIADNNDYHIRLSSMPLTL